MQVHGPRELGYFRNGEFTDKTHTVSSSWRLIHELGTSAVCPYSEGSSRDSPSPRLVRRDDDVLLKDAHYSSAALENVTAASVFVAAESGLCMGIILEYCNGTKTSLGQCRLGYDRCITVRQPTQLCWAAADYRCPKLRRSFKGLVLLWCSLTGGEFTGTMGLCVRNWSYHDMVGSVELWFNDKSTKLRFMS